MLLEFLRRIAYPARLVVRGDKLWRFTEGQLLCYRESADAIIVRGSSLPAECVRRLEQRSQGCLGLDQDLTEFYSLAQSDADSVACG